MKKSCWLRFSSNLKLPFVTQLIQTKVVYIWCSLLQLTVESRDLPQAEKVKLGYKELFDKEQIGIKEPFPVTNLPFTL